MPLSYVDRQNHLESLIQARLQFEKINPIHPELTIKQKEDLKIIYKTDDYFYDIHGYTLLHYAAINGDIEKAHAILSRCNKVDIHPRKIENNKITSLQLALDAGHLEMAKILKTYGADFCAIELCTIKDVQCKAWIEKLWLEKYKYHPMQLACFAAQMGHLEVLKQAFNDVGKSLLTLH